MGPSPEVPENPRVGGSIPPLRTTISVNLPGKSEGGKGPLRPLRPLFPLCLRHRCGSRSARPDRSSTFSAFLEFQFRTGSASRPRRSFGPCFFELRWSTPRGAFPVCHSQARGRQPSTCRRSTPCGRASSSGCPTPRPSLRALGAVHAVEHRRKCSSRCNHACCGVCRGDEGATLNLSCATNDLQSVVATGPCTIPDTNVLSQSTGWAANNGKVLVQVQGPGACQIEPTFATGFKYSTTVTFASQPGGTCGGPQCTCPDYLAPTLRSNHGQQPKRHLRAPAGCRRGRWRLGRAGGRGRVKGVPGAQSKLVRDSSV
jgi:hypothetical protein